ncbi:hypothetical protein F4779DRAFT_609762 [Xylariaceae sp. FL0662B]|nr:hypothetical protein F4779DRAFT_609762 [Xylariaceae sp. FL0662B]
MTSNPGNTYAAGSTIHDVSTWRAIGICGTGCVFSSACSSAQAGTWQAQQPHDFPLNSK